MDEHDEYRMTNMEVELDCLKSEMKQIAMDVTTMKETLKWHGWVLALIFAAIVTNIVVLVR